MPGALGSILEPKLHAHALTMSPFSTYLRTLRRARGLRQIELAHMLGYEASYLSALERSQKGPPRKKFIERLIRGLKLDAAEQAALSQALEASRRQISLPAHADEQEYVLLHQLEPQLGRLHPLQIELIKLVLSIPEKLEGVSQVVYSSCSMHQPTRTEAPKM